MNNHFEFPAHENTLDESCSSIPEHARKKVEGVYGNAVLILKTCASIKLRGWRCLSLLQSTPLSLCRTSDLRPIETLNGLPLPLTTSSQEVRHQASETSLPRGVKTYNVVFDGNTVDDVSSFYFNTWVWA